MNITEQINFFVFHIFLACFIFLCFICNLNAENPLEIINGLQIKATDADIEILPGKLKIKGKAITISKKHILQIDPAPVFEVKNEALKLSSEAPRMYYRGTKLKGPKTKSGSLIPGSLVIRKTPDGEK